MTLHWASRTLAEDAPDAWSVYFSDPEGNRIEMFRDTPWYVPQPPGFEIDLDQSEDELYRETEAICRAQPGFKPIEEWRGEIAAKIAATMDAA
jgi:catechol 2,3-dioxygenase